MTDYGTLGLQGIGRTDVEFYLEGGDMHGTHDRSRLSGCDSWSHRRTSVGGTTRSASMVGVVPLAPFVAATTDGLVMTGGTLLAVTTMVMDPTRGSATVVARGACRHGSRSTLLAPGQGLVELAGDDEGIDVAADAVEHLSTARRAHRHGWVPSRRWSTSFVDIVRRHR
jgi:hypothetical protein